MLPATGKGTCLRAGAVPEGDALEVLLLEDIHQVPLVHVNKGHDTRLVWQGHHLQHVLEAGVPGQWVFTIWMRTLLDGDLVEEVPRLDVVYIELGLLVVPAVAGHEALVRSHHYVLELLKCPVGGRGVDWCGEVDWCGRVILILGLVSPECSTCPQIITNTYAIPKRPDLGRRVES